MALNSRAKGQTGEREIADLLNGIIFRVTGTFGDFKRNLQQTQSGGFDLFSEMFPYFAIEVKRVENLTPAVIDNFWAQTTRQAKLFTPFNHGQALLPVLLYRKNRVAWRCRIQGKMVWDDAIVVVDVTEQAFTAWFERQITKIIAKRNDVAPVPQ